MRHKLGLLFLGTFASLVPVGAAPGDPPDPVFEEVTIDPAGTGDCKAVGDINGDGKPDLLLAGSPGEDLAWYAWPDWRRTVIASPALEFTTDMALGDVDGDGDLDMVVPDREEVLWFRNPRPGGDPSDGAAWQRLVVGSAGNVGKDIELADYNLDGRMDVGVRTNGTVFVFFRGASGSWARTTICQGLGGEGLASGDVDGDGDTDLVYAGTWLENPEPAQDAAAAEWPVHTIDSSLYVDAKIVVADIDGDGGAEIAFSCSEGDGAVRWYEPAAGDPRGQWTFHTVHPNLPGCHTLQVGDIDRDGDMDFALAQMHTHGGAVFVVLNEGGAVSWRFVQIGSGGIHNGVLADVDADGDLDLYGANWTGHPPARLWRHLAAAPRCPADFDSDGAVDSSDIAAFLSEWIAEVNTGGSAVDWDGNGAVTSGDISAFLSDWMGELGGC